MSSGDLVSTVNPVAKEAAVLSAPVLTNCSLSRVSQDQARPVIAASAHDGRLFKAVHAALGLLTGVTHRLDHDSGKPSDCPANCTTLLRGKMQVMHKCAVRSWIAVGADLDLAEISWWWY